MGDIFPSKELCMNQILEHNIDYNYIYYNQLSIYCLSLAF